MNVPDNIPYTSDITKKVIYALAKNYPTLSVKSIGTSVLGSPIYALTFGYGEKKLFINGSHHANEWITTPILLKFVHKILDAFSQKKKLCSRDVYRLLMKATVIVVPLVNPDGVDLVNGAIDTENPVYKKTAQIASDYSDIPFPSGWKANIDGVDLNLNYPAGWGIARENKKRIGICGPAPRDFVGFYPLCAPESRAIYEFSITNSFEMTLSYHTQGRVIYWKYMDFLPANSHELAMTLARESGYTAEVTPHESGFAGYKDWFISCYNLPGFTIEAGEGTNPLPMTNFESIYEENERLICAALGLL